MDALLRLARLLRERNEIDAEIALAIGRPALIGHIGEFVASQVFDIELHAAANAAGADGVFRSGPLAGRTVNIKFYGKHEGLLDIASSRPDYYLVLTGANQAKASSKQQTRPIVIESVFLLDSISILAELNRTGAKPGTATSVRKLVWDDGRIWPNVSSPLLTISAEQAGILRAFSSISDTQ